MSKSIKMSAVASLLILLGACGETDLERTATGAVIGGATAAVFGGNVGTAALVGGAAGAISCNANPGGANC